jgi:hypothetical protein
MALYWYWCLRLQNAEADDEEDDNEFVLPANILDDDHMIDCDANDCIPFDNEVQEVDEDSDLDLFHDTHTWEEDDEDVTRSRIL